MKNSICLILTLITFIVITSCKKNEVKVTPTNLTEGAFLKIGHWVARNLNPQIQIKINGQRVSYSFRYAESFPGGGANQGGSNTNDYLEVPAGKSIVQVSYVNFGTINDSATIYSGSINVTKGLYYSLMLTDSSNVKATLLDDNILGNVPANNTAAVFKFFNGLPNVPLVDVYNGTTSTTPIFSNVAFNAVTNYTNFPLGSVTLVLRPAGAVATTSTIIGSQAITVAGGRVYTVVARGYNGLPATDIRRVLISTMTNR